MVMNVWLTSFAFHVNWPPHSSDKAISNSDLETARSRSLMCSKGKIIRSAQCPINSLPFHFTSIRTAIPEIQLFRNLILKHPRSRSWVRSKVKVTYSGFEISLIRSSETSKNDSQTSGIPAGLVRQTTAYLWFSHKLHWLYIFQTSEWYIRTSDFYNPLTGRTSAFNLKVQSLILYPLSNRCLSSLFHMDRTNHSWDMAKIVFDLEKTHPNFLKENLLK